MLGSDTAGQSLASPIGESIDHGSLVVRQRKVHIDVSRNLRRQTPLGGS